MAVADEVPGSLGTTLVSRLQGLREAVLWKIDGVDEYDLRRPLTPTGTNLLGLVRHLSAVEFDYFGDVFGRPTETELPWAGREDENADMWATVHETPADVARLYREAWAHAAQTFARCDLDTPGRVPWCRTNDVMSPWARSWSTCSARQRVTPGTWTSCANHWTGQRVSPP